MLLRLSIPKIALAVVVLAAGLTGIAGPAEAKHRRHPPAPQTVAANVTPGQFDYYVLALSQQDEFCATHPGKLGCAQGHAVVHGLALHGLWPNRNQGECYEATNVPDVPLTLADTTLQALQPVMPAASCSQAGHEIAGDACLTVHEWYKHGRLAGVFASADDYFGKAAGLVTTIRTQWTNLGALLQSAGDKPFSEQDLRAALTKDIGAEPKFLLLCDQLSDPENPDVKINYLSEIDLALSKDHLDAFPRPESFNDQIFAYKGCNPSKPLKSNVCNATEIYYRLH
ncbi:MAG: hypothetical protein P4L82_15745 [Ancalomicrobiaceae bacterium]|nr:hypothetical protein [Ancalomicrobiaceae bacterium]